MPQVSIYDDDFRRPRSTLNSRSDFGLRMTAGPVSLTYTEIVPVGTLRRKQGPRYLCVGTDLQQKKSSTFRDLHLSSHAQLTQKTVLQAHIVSLLESIAPFISRVSDLQLKSLYIPWAIARSVQLEAGEDRPHAYAGRDTHWSATRSITSWDIASF